METKTAQHTQGERGGMSSRDRIHINRIMVDNEKMQAAIRRAKKNAVTRIIWRDSYRRSGTDEQPSEGG